VPRSLFCSLSAAEVFVSSGEEGGGRGRGGRILAGFRQDLFIYLLPGFFSPFLSFSHSLSLSLSLSLMPAGFSISRDAPLAAPSTETGYSKPPSRAYDETTRTLKSISGGQDLFLIGWTRNSLGRCWTTGGGLGYIGYTSVRGECRLGRSFEHEEGALPSSCHRA